jgi:hypothetical protein
MHPHVAKWVYKWDCGFLILKNLEGSSNVRKPPTFSQKYMVNIRKLYVDKWLHGNQ